MDDYQVFPGCAEFLPTVVISPNRLHVNHVDPGLGRYSPGPQGGAELEEGSQVEGSDVELGESKITS